MRVKNKLFKPIFESHCDLKLDELYDFQFSSQTDLNAVPIQEKLDENEGKDLVQETITTFDDSQVKHEPYDHSDQYILNNTMPDVSLDQFLRRPIDIGTVSWATTDTLGQSKGTYIFPDVLYNNATFQKKLEKIAWWRPNIEITIRMNGTAMHYGKIVFAWIPQASSLDPAYYNSYFSAFSNKWIQVSANANQATVFTIPFSHYREFLQVGAQATDLFTLYSYVSAPLRSVNGTASPISYSLFARVVEPRLFGYNFTSNFSSQAGEGAKVRSVKGKNESERKTDDSKVVSSSVKSLADTISKFSWVPVVGELAAPVSAGVSAVSSILSWFGLSAPPNLQLTQPMQIRQPRMLQVEDTPTTLLMGPKADMSVSKDYAFVNDNMESSSVLRFMQRPALKYVGTITSSGASGDVLYVNWVTPVCTGCFDYVTPVDNTAMVTTPLYWMSKYFQFWRGGIRIHLSFICSHFHTLRVRVFYIPYVAATSMAANPTNPSLAESADLINVVLDITKETDFSFTIPYMQQTEWLNVCPAYGGVGVTTANSNFTNGRWGIQLINPLSAGAAAVTSITYQVFESAAADFQVAGPTTQYTPSTGIFAPQSDINEATFYPQVDFALEDCEIPSSSMQCLFEKDYPPIGNCARGRTNEQVYHSLEINSVKQITNMLCPYKTVNPSATSTTAPVLFQINPAGYLNVYNADGSGFNWTMIMCTIFRYRRGGIRVAIRTLGVDAIVQASSLYSSAAQASSFFVSTVITSDINNVDATNVFNVCCANAQLGKLPVNPCDTVIPYHNIYKCYPNVPTSLAVGDALPNMNVTYGILTPNTNQVQFLVSGADDFILGWQLGIPQTTNVLPT